MLTMDVRILNINLYFCYISGLYISVLSDDGILFTLCLIYTLVNQFTHLADTLFFRLICCNFRLCNLHYRSDFVVFMPLIFYSSSRSACVLLAIHIYSEVFIILFTLGRTIFLWVGHQILWCNIEAFSELLQCKYL